MAVLLLCCVASLASCYEDVRLELPRAGTARMTHMWATPVFVSRPEWADEALLAEIGNATVQAFEHFLREGDAEGDINDSFYGWQEACHLAHKNKIVEAAEECDERPEAAKTYKALLSSPAWSTLKQGIRAHVREYLVETGAPENHIEAVLGSESFLWGTVQSDRRSHRTHTHDGSCMSGVFYVSAPAGSGPFYTPDQRGHIQPFASEAVAEPTAGVLFVFPPWMPHRVGQSDCGDANRVSIAFNSGDCTWSNFMMTTKMVHTPERPPPSWSEEDEEAEKVMKQRKEANEKRVIREAEEGEKLATNKAKATKGAAERAVPLGPVSSPPSIPVAPPLPAAYLATSYGEAVVEPPPPTKATPSATVADEKFFPRGHLKPIGHPELGHRVGLVREVGTDGGHISLQDLLVHSLAPPPAPEAGGPESDDVGGSGGAGQVSRPLPEGAPDGAALLQPLMLRDAARSWPMLRLLSDEWLSQAGSGIRNVVVEKDKVEERGGPARTATLPEFVELMRQEPQHHFGIFSLGPSEGGGPLLASMALPSSYATGARYMLEPIAWVSSGGTESVLHQDHMYNLNCAVRGTKRWWFSGPENNASCYLTPQSEDPSPSAHFLNQSAVDLLEMPGFANVRWREAVQHPGDCVFVPFRWLHQVSTDPGDSLNIAFWWASLDPGVFKEAEAEAARLTADAAVDGSPGVGLPASTIADAEVPLDDDTVWHFEEIMPEEGVNEKGVEVAATSTW